MEIMLELEPEQKEKLEEYEGELKRLNSEKTQ